MKLYKVELTGMTHSVSGPIYGVSYVVAKDPSEAYEKVKVFLDSNDLGFDKDRQLKTITLMADTDLYRHDHLLFI